MPCTAENPQNPDGSRSTGRRPVIDRVGKFTEPTPPDSLPVNLTPAQGVKDRFPDGPFGFRQEFHAQTFPPTFVMGGRCDQVRGDLRMPAYPHRRSRARTAWKNFFTGIVRPAPRSISRSRRAATPTCRLSSRSKICRSFCRSGQERARISFAKMATPIDLDCSADLRCQRPGLSVARFGYRVAGCSLRVTRDPPRPGRGPSPATHLPTHPKSKIKNSKSSLFHLPLAPFHQAFLRVLCASAVRKKKLNHPLVFYR